MEPVSFAAGTITATAVFTGIAVALLLHLVNQETTPGIGRIFRTFRVVFLALAIFTGLATVSLGLRTLNLTAPEIARVIDWAYLFVLIAVVYNLLKVLDDWRRRPTVSWGMIVTLRGECPFNLSRAIGG